MATTCTKNVPAGGPSMPLMPANVFVGMPIADITPSDVSGYCDNNVPQANLDASKIITCLQTDFTTNPNPQISQTLCNGYIGDYNSGGLCSIPKYANTVFCSCVNNQLPCPTTTSSMCANLLYAYHSSAIEDAENAADCKAICMNVIDITGNNNILSKNTQTCGPGQTVNNLFKTDPILFVLVFILIIVVTMLLFVRVDDDIDDDDEYIDLSSLGLLPVPAVAPPAVAAAS